MPVLLVEHNVNWKNIYQNNVVAGLTDFFVNFDRAMAGDKGEAAPELGWGWHATRAEVSAIIIYICITK